MSNVRRVYVEKKPSFAVKAKELKHEISSYLGIQTVTNVRELIRYDVENISDDVFEKACHTVFAEPPVDDLYLEKFEAADGAHIFSVEFLPGQFDQRADSAVQCVQFLDENAQPIIRSATTYVIEGDTQYQKEKFFSRTDFAACRISCRNADPELYIPFFLEAAGIFRSVPFGNLWENRSRRNRLSFADSLDARWDFFPFSNLWFYCIWSPYGNYGDVFYRDWTGNRIFHVYSAVRTYRRRSCRSTSFSALSDLSAIMGFGVSDGLQGIYGNLAQSWNFSTESKRLSPESALIYSFIRCGNSFRMACKSMDFKQNSGFFEIF